jgi:hypothetical protein
VNNYVSGVAIGIFMSMIAIVLFAIGMVIYLSLDTTFFNSLKDNFPYPEYFSPTTASIGIFVEGLAVSIIGVYVITRIIDNLIEVGKNKS